MNTPGSDKNKKPYRSPELLSYGDIRLITMALLQMGNLDGSQTTFGTDLKTGGSAFGGPNTD